MAETYSETFRRPLRIFFLPCFALELKTLWVHFVLQRCHPKRAIRDLNTILLVNGSHAPMSGRNAVRDQRGWNSI